MQSLEVLNVVAEELSEHYYVMLEITISHIIFMTNCFDHTGYLCSAIAARTDM